MDKAWRFFKGCSCCHSKLLPVDGHDVCFFCLGEAHRVESCPHCTKFSKQAKKNHVARLQAFLLTAALSSMDPTLPVLNELPKSKDLVLQTPKRLSLEPGPMSPVKKKKKRMTNPGRGREIQRPSNQNPLRGANMRRC